MHASAVWWRLCQPHEIKRVAEESASGRDDGQRAHRGDKQAKPAPLNVSTAYLLNIFFRPASTLQRFTIQRFNAQRSCNV